MVEMGGIEPTITLRHTGPTGAVMLFLCFSPSTIFTGINLKNDF